MYATICGPICIGAGRSEFSDRTPRNAQAGPRPMSHFVLPVTQYALSGAVNIAYQTMGDGPLNLILVTGIISHVEFHHVFSGYTAFLRRLSKFSRVVPFAYNGQGLSYRISIFQSLEQRIDNALADMVDYRQL